MTLFPIHVVTGTPHGDVLTSVSLRLQDAEGPHSEEQASHRDVRGRLLLRQLGLPFPDRFCVIVVGVIGSGNRTQPSVPIDMLWHSLHH